MKQPIRKVVLACSGGLDTTSIILWLKENYESEVVVLVCNIGQDEELAGIHKAALGAGASKVHVEDLRKQFVTDFIWPLVRSGARYEGKYLLGTSIALSLLAKRQVEIALMENADAVAYSDVGPGSNQFRYGQTLKSLAPQLKVIEPPYEASRVSGHDGNLWHMSHTAVAGQDSSETAPDDSFVLTLDPRFCPQGHSEITIDFESGIPVGLNGQAIPPVQLIEDLNEIGGTNGVGRVDLIEDSIDGNKTRGIYETPGGTLIIAALRELESICLDRQMRLQKDLLSVTYAQLVYAGEWFTPLREALDAFFTKTQENVTGSITLRLFRGTIVATNRKSPFSLYRKVGSAAEMQAQYSKPEERFIKTSKNGSSAALKFATGQYEALARSV